MNSCLGRTVKKAPAILWLLLKLHVTANSLAIGFLAFLVASLQRTQKYASGLLLVGAWTSHPRGGWQV